MRLKLEPLLSAVAIGALIWIISGIVTLIISYQGMQRMFDSPMFDPAYMETIDPNTVDPFSMMFGESYQNVLLLSSVANLLQCLSWIFAGGVAGALYVVFYRRQDPMAVGGEPGVGAAAGALAVIIGYLVSAIFSTIVIMPMWGDFMARMVSVGGAEVAQMFDQMGPFMVIMVAVGAICSLIFYGAIGAVTGAIGALLGNSLVKPTP